MNEQQTTAKADSGTEMDDKGYSKTIPPYERKDGEQAEAHNQEAAPFAGNGNSAPAADSKKDTPETERGVDIARSPRPDTRDDQKVGELAAPDWRSEQPLPSSRNAVNTLDQEEPGAVSESELESAQKQEPTPKKRTTRKPKKQP